VFFFLFAIEEVSALMIVAVRELFSYYLHVSLSYYIQPTVHRCFCNTNRRLLSYIDV
jgi:hypothetical protein